MRTPFIKRQRQHINDLYSQYIFLHHSYKSEIKSLHYYTSIILSRKNARFKAKSTDKHEKASERNNKNKEREPEGKN